MQPAVVVRRPENLPVVQGGIPVNTVIGGYFFPEDGSIRRLPRRPRPTVNERFARKGKRRRARSAGVE